MCLTVGFSCHSFGLLATDTLHYLPRNDGSFEALDRGGKLVKTAESSWATVGGCMMGLITDNTSS